jgi:hypothetical protein
MKKGTQVRSKANNRGAPRARLRVPSTPTKGSRGVKRKGKLPQTAKTKTEAEMEQRLESLEPGSVRYRVLVSAIEFKRSWLELAEYLTQVMKGGQYKEWGYRTFEAYAQHELHLKRETAIKLTRSYDFLASHEQSLLDSSRERDRGAPLPAFQAIDVLAEARANPNLSERDYKEIRDQVFEDDLSASQVKKLIREKAPEPLVQKKDEPMDRIRRCLQLAERLYGLVLEEESIPATISKAVEEAVGGLRRMLEE